MVRDLLIVHIAAGSDLFVGAAFQNGGRRLGERPKAGQARDIFPDLLCHRAGKDPGVRPWVGHQLFLIQFLHDFQRFVGAYLKQPGAFVLQLRQIKKQGRIAGLLFLFKGSDFPLHGRLGQKFNELLGRFLLFKAVFLVKSGRVKIAGTFCGPPFRLQRKGLSRFLILQPEGRDHPVKGRFHEFPDFPLSSDDHSEDAGHDPAHRKHRPPLSQIGGHRRPVF